MAAKAADPVDELVIPDHMNQFHELLANGKPGDPWPDLWGRNYNGLNCAYTVGAICARFATRNTYRPAPNDLRELAADHEGGAMPPDVRRALVGSGKIDRSLVWLPRSGLSWDKVTAFRDQGRYIWLATDYEEIPDAKSCQPSFDGDHAIGLPPLAPKADGRIAYDDPLCDHLKWIDPAVIRKAAQKCARNFGSPGLIVLIVKQRPKATRPPDPDKARIADLEAMLDEANSRLEAIAELAVPVTSPPD
jgi:hypothetical protein